MQYVDLRNVPGSIRGQGKEFARQLKIIADRSLWVDVETISNDPQGHADDELPGHVDIVARIKTPEGPVNIQMQRTADAEGIEVWKPSNRTVAEIPRLYKHFGYGKYGDKLSRILPEYEILGLEVWQWVMLLFIAVPAFLVSWAITYVCKILIGLVKKRHSIVLIVF